METVFIGVMVDYIMGLVVSFIKTYHHRRRIFFLEGRIVGVSLNLMCNDKN
jgi:hypothetical protein